MPERAGDRRDESLQAHHIQQSLVSCTREGIAAQVMLVILDYYLIPLGLFLGATTSKIGLMVSIPSLVSSISQLFAVRAIQMAGSRWKLLLNGTLIQAIILAVLAALVYLPIKGKILALIVFLAVFRVIGSLIGPAWGSLVSEYLSQNRRGKYFGMRSRLVGIAGLLSVAFWGIFLDYLRRFTSEAVGFFVLFLAAAGCRLVSRHYISKMVELPLHQTPESEFTLWMFLRRFRESNFVKFIFYVSAITFATQLASPYLSVYMLEGLEFSYLEYMTVHLSSILMGFIAFPLWGKHADVIGNARILKITSMFIPLIPLFWIFARNVYLLAAAEMVSGFIWGGFNLCAINFIYDAVSPDKRVRCLSYFNLINGAAIFAGASLGGFLAERLPPFFGQSFYTLFLISAAVRFAADFFLSPKFREVRADAPHVSVFDLFFSVVGLRPIIGINGELLALTPKQAADFRRRSATDRRHSDRPSAGSENRS